ncbi:hypothetical protein ABA45_07135 [Marinobacter psychrophilus]|jgi:hypothetical protein|uniref:DUF1656 domain-containing protein n=1 Tax=Marinobacter psychrophilus TaxID=330734 RepID=A0A0H4HZX5_9GAMM|nr:DUF1656 domain-containing protein [Marinobacter psychrophilus]AKO52229.1 hypothetical protein ABA45_07135 [Marinobacter psychrophilus]
MFHELSLGGMLFSPLVVLGPLAFLMTMVTRWVLHRLHWRRYIWKDAWFDVGIFVCYLALTIYWMGD